MIYNVIIYFRKINVIHWYMQQIYFVLSLFQSSKYIYEIIYALQWRYIKIYPVMREECINHVHKRLDHIYNRLIFYIT